MSQLGRSAGLTGFVELARGAGLDPQRLAVAAGIPAAALTDPDLKVSAEAMSQLIELAAAQSGGEDFGLRMAEKRRLSNMGPLGLAIRQQPTLRKALQVVADFGWLQNDSLGLSIEDVGDVTLLRCSTPAWRGAQEMELVMGVLFRSAQALRGAAWRPLEIRFTHAPPANLDGHRRMFGMLPLFDQDFLGMVLDRADIVMPIAGADPAMAAEATRYLKQIAGRRGLALRDKVSELIQLQLPNGGCTVDRVAQRLGVDRRTLHRRLANEGTSFTQLLATARSDMAASLLANSERSLQSVAEMLGFASLSAFAHWFRRNFACTASAYRAGRGELPADSGLATY